MFISVQRASVSLRELACVGSDDESPSVLERERAVCIEVGAMSTSALQHCANDAYCYSAPASKCRNVNTQVYLVYVWAYRELSVRLC